MKSSRTRPKLRLVEQIVLLSLLVGAAGFAGVAWGGIGPSATPLGPATDSEVLATPEPLTATEVPSTVELLQTHERIPTPEGTPTPEPQLVLSRTDVLAVLARTADPRVPLSKGTIKLLSRNDFIDFSGTGSNTSGGPRPSGATRGLDDYVWLFVLDEPGVKLAHVTDLSFMGAGAGQPSEIDPTAETPWIFIGIGLDGRTRGFGPLDVEGPPRQLPPGRIELRSPASVPNLIDRTAELASLDIEAALAERREAEAVDQATAIAGATSSRRNAESTREAERARDGSLVILRDLPCPDEDSEILRTDRSAISYGGDVVALVEIEEVYPAPTRSPPPDPNCEYCFTLRPDTFQIVVLRALRILRTTGNQPAVARYVVPVWTDYCPSECGTIPSAQLVPGTRGIAFIAELNHADELNLATAQASPAVWDWVWRLVSDARARSAQGDGGQVKGGQVNLWLSPEGGTYRSPTRSKDQTPCAKESGRPIEELAEVLDVPVEWLTDSE